VSQELARTEELTKEPDDDEHEAVTDTVADAVEEALERRVLDGKGLGPPEDDAIGDDEPHEDRQLAADLVGEGLQEFVGHDHQGRDDRHLHEDADAPRDVAADETHREVGEGDDADDCDRHDE
jgi:hypothetical protein